MKELNIRKIKFNSPYPDIGEISARLDESGTMTKITEVNWKEFPYKPDVAVSLAYTDNELLLKYYVTENWFKAEKTEINDPVYEDSCVEFFVSPDDTGVYYNLEFNALGTCLMGAGKDRHARRMADPQIIKKIRRGPSVGKCPIQKRTGEFSWTITIAIPPEVFFHHKISGLKGERYRANFYKCGDKLSVPHYISWNPIGTEKPDFHRPEYFGLLKFV
jgi:hypothetical protein